MRSARAAKALAVIMAFTVLSKALGFVREMVVAAYFGASAVTDAYLAATLVPALLLNVLGGRSLGTAFIPVYCRVTAGGTGKRGGKFTGTVLVLVFVLFSGAAACGFFLAPLLVGTIAPGLPAQTKELSVYLARLLLAGIPLLASTGLLASLLNTHDHFAVPAALGIPLNLAVMGFLCFSGAEVVKGLVTGTLAGYLLQVGMLLLALNRKRVRVFSGLDCREPGLAQMGRLLLPVMAGGVMTQFAPVVNRVFASQLAEGTISVLNFADRIIQVPLGLLVTAIMTVSYPAMARAFARNSQQEVSKLANAWLGVLLFITVPAALLLAQLSYPLVQVFFERGAFNSQATAATAGALLFYSIGLPFAACGRFLAQIFNTYHDFKTPIWIGLSTTALNVLFCLLLVKPMGYCGLALASTASSAAGLPIFLVCLKAKTGVHFHRRTWKKFLLVTASAAAAALAMVAFSTAVKEMGGNPFGWNPLYLLTVGSAGLAAYFFSARFFGLEEADVITALLQRLKSSVRRD